MKERRVGRFGWLCLLAVSGWVFAVSAQPAQPLVPRAVLKLIIDHPALAGYLHPEMAGRVPLVVSDHLLAEGVAPSKFGQPVRILADRDMGSRPHMRFTSFEVNGARAKAVLEYRVEGVEAVFNLERAPSGWWSVLDANVARERR